MKYRLRSLLLLFLISSVSLAQQIIKGSVITAEDNQPLPGVSILLKGTTTGTSTDFDGNFSINAPVEGILIFSFLGYVTQEVPINSNHTITVTLKEDISALDEVVVVGYGTQKKSDITGAVSSVSMKGIERIPLARADEVLQGQAAGVYVQKNDASPNADVTIRIRGVSSITGGNNPLVIVDGIQGVRLSDVHPNDIKSIEVLKDASATAIYGSRGASGVILVTTNKGVSGKPVVSYNTYATFSTVREKLDLMNAAQYAEVNNARALANGLPIPFTNEEIAEFTQSGGTDWQDEIYRNGYEQNHHLTVSGGSDNISYNFTGDYLNTDGIVIGSSFTKYSLRSNISVDLLKNLEFKLNSFYTNSTNHPTKLNSRDAQGSPIYASYLFSPTTPVFNEDGTYTGPFHEGRNVGPATEYNPVALALEPTRDFKSNQLILIPTLSYEITDGLKISTSLSYQNTTNENSLYFNEKIINGTERDRQAGISNSRWTTFQNTNILEYEKTLNDKHALNVTGVFEQQTQELFSSSIRASGFLTNATLYNNIQSAEQIQFTGSGKTEQSLNSYLGRVNYGYDDRYLITLTGRYDESSVFAENNKGAFFPSVAVGWNISNEKFLEKSSVIENMKLRASYGEVGNQAIAPYQSLAQLVTGTGANFSFDGQTATNGVQLSTRAPNPDLKWETTKQVNIGLDVELFNGALAFTADYYDKKTEDLLLTRTLLQSSGFLDQLVNAGEVQNKGVELYLNVRPTQGDFSWNSQLTFAKNENEVLSLNGDETRIPMGGAGLPGFNNSVVIEKGRSIGLIEGYEFDGIYSTDEAILAATYGVTPGSPKYVDQNNDGLINGDDLTVIANTLPDFTFGWNNFFAFKNWDLAVIVQGVSGNDIYNIGKSRLESNTHGVGIARLRTWTVANQNTDVPAYDAVGVNRNDSRWVEDGSYIRIKNISLGYTLPNSILDKIKVASARLYLTGTNLFTFTDYSGYDPEGNNASGISNNAGSNSKDAFIGVDHSSYPSQKSFTIGLDIKI